jgi:hypothetical protein
VAPDTDDITHLLPEFPEGEPQYRIRERANGIERVVPVGEIKAALE